MAANDRPTPTTASNNTILKNLNSKLFCLAISRYTLEIFRSLIIATPTALKKSAC